MLITVPTQNIVARKMRKSREKQLEKRRVENYKVGERGGEGALKYTVSRLTGSPKSGKVFMQCRQHRGRDSNRNWGGKGESEGSAVSLKRARVARACPKTLYSLMTPLDKLPEQLPRIGLLEEQENILTRKGGE